MEQEKPRDYHEPEPEPGNEYPNQADVGFSMQEGVETSTKDPSIQTPENKKTNNWIKQIKSVKSREVESIKNQYKDKIAEDIKDKDCTHHWQIEEQNGESMLQGICKKCGSSRPFLSASHERLAGEVR